MGLRDRWKSHSPLAARDTAPAPALRLNQTSSRVQTLLQPPNPSPVSRLAPRSFPPSPLPGRHLQHLPAPLPRLRSPTPSPTNHSPRIPVNDNPTSQGGVAPAPKRTARTALHDRRTESGGSAPSRTAAARGLFSPLHRGGSARWWALRFTRLQRPSLSTTKTTALVGWCLIWPQPPPRALRKK